VDCENVHEMDPAVIGQKSITVTLIVGAKQTKLDLGVLEKMMASAASVHVVRLTSNRKSALNLALFYYLGCAVLADPTGYFHLISKDKGFDPLIEHLRSRHVSVRRHDDFTTLTFSGPTNTQQAQTDDLLSRALKHLRKNVKNRPKRRGTLESRFRSLYGNVVTDAEISEWIEKLCQDGHVKINEKGIVTYHL
jgi:PIN domain